VPQQLAPQQKSGFAQVWPLAQGAGVQLPFWHMSPVAQALPQLPQFCVSAGRYEQWSPGQQDSPNPQVCPQAPPLLELLVPDEPLELLVVPPEVPPLEPPPGQLGHKQTGQQSWGGVTWAQGLSQGPGNAQEQTGPTWQIPLWQVSWGPQSASLVQSPQADPQFGSQDPATSTWSTPVPKQAAVL